MWLSAGLQTSWKVNHQYCWWAPAGCGAPLPVYTCVTVTQQDLGHFHPPTSHLVPPWSQFSPRRRANYYSDFYHHRLDILEPHKNAVYIFLGLAFFFFFWLRFEIHPYCCVYLVVCLFYCAFVLCCMDGLQSSPLLMDIWAVSSIGLFWVILKVLERVWKQEVLIFLVKTFLVERRDVSWCFRFYWWKWKSGSESGRHSINVSGISVW